MLDNEQNSTVEQDAQGATTETSPASGSNQEGNPSANGAAQSATPSVPFHKNPEFQGYLDRQRKGWERDSNKRFDEMNQSYQKQMEELKAQFTRQSGSPLSDSDRSQLRQLAQLIKSDPEAARELGIADIQSLKEQFERSQAQSSEQAVESEANSVARTYAEKYGYEARDIKQQIWDFIQEDDYWGNQPMSKGVFSKAAKDFMSERSQELADRAANMKLVTENKEKTKAGSQRPIGTGQPITQAPPKSMREALMRGFDKYKDGASI